MAEPCAEIKMRWATDGDGSDIKSLKNYFNMEPRLQRENLVFNAFIYLKTVYEFKAVVPC